MRNEKSNQRKPALRPILRDFSEAGSVRHSPKGEAGFTLIEVLLAFLILMIGILAVLSLFPVGMKLSQDMVESSTAALVARNARGSMEATNLADKMVSTYNASGGFPRPGTSTNFPRYFPNPGNHNMADTFCAALTNTTVQPPINCYVKNDKIVDTANPLYSWDARFSVGQGAYSFPWGWTQDEAQEWFSKYFRYYTVQISVYRGNRKTGYEDVNLGGGSITGIVADMEPGPGNPDLNIIPVCQLTLSSVSADLEVGWHIRIPGEQSDWYRIEEIDADNNRILTLDRPYVGPSGAKTGIIATGSLVGHFTTFLAAGNE